MLWALEETLLKDPPIIAVVVHCCRRCTLLPSLYTVAVVLVFYVLPSCDLLL